MAKWLKGLSKCYFFNIAIISKSQNGKQISQIAMIIGGAIKKRKKNCHRYKAKEITRHSFTGSNRDKSNTHNIAIMDNFNVIISL